MSKQSTYRIYLPQKLDPAKDVSIKENDTIHYIRNVLRLKLDYVLSCFNEIDGEFRAKIIICDKKEIKLTLLNDKADKEVIELPSLSIAPSLIKNDKFASLIDMAVQNGATHIHPLISQNTVHRKTNIERLERIIIEATEQSERFAPAKIHQPKLLREMDFKSFNAVIYANEKEDSDRTFKTTTLTLDNILLLTGPEGGFTSDELEFLANLPNASSISLGPLILRAETAMIRLMSYVDFARRF
jgi:16S rRNA (uracil1498-N3)-methyltransferase